MKLKMGRIIITAIAVEALTVLLLVAAVAIFGPADPNQTQAYAEWLGYWLGPLGGFGLCVLGGWFVAKNVGSDQIKHGIALGIAVAIIDIAILVASSTAFQAVFAISNIGRIIAGYIGGRLAARSAGDGHSPVT